MWEKTTQLKEARNVPVLDGQNFPLWNIMMDVELTARGVCEICYSELQPDANATTTRNWNRINGKEVHLILRRVHPNLLISLVDGVTEKNAKALWNEINGKYASHTFINRGRTWFR
ncbi:hypothetical protein O181_003010 [Austropuccinia psidii MF-1]|uniref:Uncharacterized protein n=1 Tax=Austropuccinia psidii MF-1 TaxID=1389203 RepID=A0A9Q3BDK1_9BASI|nr:hypothetical protein [Austropuccinia psidii MF-1]